MKESDKARALDLEPVLPSFALPTTSHIIRQIAESPSKALIVVEAHKEFIKELRGPFFLTLDKES